MKRKKSIKKNKKKIIDLHMYGIFNSKKHTITKVSLDPEEIQMEIALIGGLDDDLSECEFKIKVLL